MIARWLSFISQERFRIHFLQRKTDLHSKICRISWPCLMLAVFPLLACSHNTYRITIEEKLQGDATSQEQRLALENSASNLQRPCSMWLCLQISRLHFIRTVSIETRLFRVHGLAIKRHHHFMVTESSRQQQVIPWDPYRTKKQTLEQHKHHHTK